MTGRFFCLCVRIVFPNLMIWLSTVSRVEHLCFLTGVAEWIFATRMVFHHPSQRVAVLQEMARSESGRMEKDFKICILRCEAEERETVFEA